ncbi:MAG TPA: tetratricopeptide repeat protein [Anaerolineaceae bacterium]|nr:tetratricopeptide repeat protein [Anaerolineaceae bacterium]HPN50747.1 tetratricopeptide repeat protein [Anaerolineaceae bacterium]
MAETPLFDQAMEAIEKRDKSHAREILARLLKDDPTNVACWLWMSTLVETSKEQIYCLQEVLKFDPNNETARRGLISIGGLQADPQKMPPPGLVKRKWQVAAPTVAKETQAKTPLPWKKILPGAVLGVAALVLMVVGIIGLGRRPAVDRGYAQVVNTMPPSSTPLPTSSPVVRSVTPRVTGTAPLWTQLEATYTPTPLVINTPHPRTEAYRSAMSAYGRGEWDKVVNFMEQVYQSDETAVDALYYVGEGYRMQREYEKALQAYNRGIKVDSGFAPLFLGRARVAPLVDKKADPLADLLLAIELDASLAEAHFELARYYIGVNQLELAQESLDRGTALQPGSPYTALYQAEIDLAAGRAEPALEKARQAQQMDITLLETYLVMAEAMQANGMMTESLEPLSIYLGFRKNEAQPYLLQARAVYSQGDLDGALGIINKALDLNPKNPAPYLERGLIYIDKGELDLARKDLNYGLGLDHSSFELSLNLGRVFMLQGFVGDGFIQINKSEELAKTDRQFAALYYWRAKSLLTLGRNNAALEDFTRLLALPPEAVPEDWAAEAEQALLPTPTATVPATLTPTATLTPPPTETLIPPTAQPTAAGAKTATPSPTRKP